MFPRMRLWHFGFVMALMGIPAYATPVIQSLTPSAGSPQTLGTPVTWQTAASDTDAGTLNYRYRVILGTSNSMVRDYSLSNSFQFAGSAQADVLSSPPVGTPSPPPALLCLGAAALSIGARCLLRAAALMSSHRATRSWSSSR